MKRVLFILILLTVSLKAQPFMVEKVSGKAYYLRGGSENYTEVRQGDKLLGSDMLVTMENSLVILERKGQSFVLKGNSALGINSIKKLSINELLLALAMEEIRSAPRRKNPGSNKSTAVYGSDAAGKKVVPSSKDIGDKRINGARQLAENGFRESSVIVTKETFRKYPQTGNVVAYRMFLADVLEKLKLFDEAYAEYSFISNLSLSGTEKELVSSRMRYLAGKIQKD